MSAECLLSKKQSLSPSLWLKRESYLTPFLVFQDGIFAPLTTMDAAIFASPNQMEHVYVLVQPTMSYQRRTRKHAEVNLIIEAEYQDCTRCYLLEMILVRLE